MSVLTVDGTSTWITDVADTRTVLSDGPTGDLGIAAQINGLTKFALDVQSVLGLVSLLRAPSSTLAARLAVQLAPDGSLQKGTIFPVSPPPINGQLFYRTDTKIVYIYDTATAQWVEAFTSAIYSLADGTRTFTGPITVKSAIAGLRLIGQEVGAGDWTIREVLNSLRTLVNTGTESAPILIEDNFFVPTGGKIGYWGTSAPPGWLMCDGAAVSRTTYARLFAVIGTAAGTGDGSTTFNVPDYRGRTSIGVDAATGRITSASVGGGNAAAIGGTGGFQTHTLSGGEAPVHVHNVASSGAVGGGVGASAQSATAPLITSTSSSAGGGGAHSNTQPWLAENVIIKT